MTNTRFITIGDTFVRDLFPGREILRGIYTGPYGNRGDGPYIANVRRGFGLQMVAGSTARSILGDLGPSIGTREGICARWYFDNGATRDRFSRYLAESHDEMRRAMIFHSAAAMTLDHESADEYGDIANRYFNRSEMSYGAAQEIYYDVQ